ncbi:hypothetical protein BGZ76_004910 [Entomortierella beljakovae]|nr:hypothetical protein BGZ76_004910 [Entomortierella beljakovae]
MKTFDLDLEGNSALLASNNLKYRIAYFGIHFAGTSSRGILAYAGADWTPEYPDWGNEKSNMPFEVIPVLTIVHPNGKELVLAENVAIDIFLAKQFDLHGKNAWEEALINSFYSSSNTMFFQEVMNIFFWESVGKTDEEKKKYLDTFLNEQLGKWARIHEAHLANNQLNGHYVGSRTTLADIRTTTLLDATEKIVGKERVATIVNETKTPGIIKVRKNVESKASYQTWVTSEEYQKYDAKSANLVKENHPELV